MTNRATAIGVGLIGCGRVAQAIHLPVLMRLAGVRVVALAEPDPDRRAAARRHAPAALAVAEPADLLAEPAVAAVVICAPPALHAPLAIEAFAHGKHVYLEKPLATDAVEGRAVLDAWRVAGTVGQIGFNYRANPPFAALRRGIAGGRVGEVVAIRSVFSAAISDLPAWKTSLATGGGALLDLASHHLDLIPWLVGRPVEAVTALVRSQRSEGDSVVLELRLVGGLLAQVFCSLCAVEEDRVEVYGRAGKLSVDRYSDHAPRWTPPHLASAPWHGIAGGWRALAGLPYAACRFRAIGHEPSYERALAAFVRAVAGSADVDAPDLAAGMRSLAIAAAADASMRTERMAPVSDLDVEAGMGLDQMPVGCRTG